jgi:DNA-binding YbaB/EbfC family protein
MPKQPDMNELLKQAQSMQQKLLDAQAVAADQEVEGQAGGGAVKVKVTGGMEFTAVEIDASVLPGGVEPDDVEMLEDLVLAAIHDAVAKAQSVTQEAMGGLDLGGLGKLLG